MLSHIKISEMLGTVALPRVTLLRGQGGGLLRPRSSKPAGATQQDPVSNKQNKQRTHKPAENPYDSQKGRQGATIVEGEITESTPSDSG